MKTLRIASRKSKLALYQTHLVAKLLRETCGVETEIITMDTTGDLVTDRPLPSIGGKGLFTRELEERLLDGTVELAVHSLKDLPSELPDGLIYAGSPTRANPFDAFISTKWKTFSDAPEDGTIATGSVRRRAQLRNKKRTLKFTDLRGNIDTRLAKLESNGWDGIIMAAAALERLDRAELISDTLVAKDGFVPAVGQGAIGIEINASRQDVQDYIDAISCEETVTAVSAERVFMAALEGGCSVSLAAYCHRLPSGQWHFDAWVSDVEGADVIDGSWTGDDATELAKIAIDDFMSRGASRLLARH